MSHKRELDALAVQVHHEGLEGVFDAGTEVAGTQAAASNYFGTLANTNNGETVFIRKRNTKTLIQCFFQQIAHKNSFITHSTNFPPKLCIFLKKNKHYF